jgi:DNA-binding response OmpR family regulator
MKKLLIIEDDTSIRENFCEIFNEEGYNVAGASCGKEGIELTASFQPDLIICDIMMPGMDGFEVKEILSRDKKTSIIPFIYLTARTDIRDVQRAMELGADDYITKPIGALKLLSLVAKRLQRIEELKRNNDEIKI